MDTDRHKVTIVMEERNGGGGDRGGQLGDLYLWMMVREGLSEVVTSEHRSEW
jgi:hypothetical protein